jgi:hypothetical protein
VDDGSLYAVHPLGSAGAAPDAKAAAANWVENIASELDDAMRKTPQPRPQDLRRDSPVGISSRFNATGRALDEMRARMAPLAGMKEPPQSTRAIKSIHGTVHHQTERFDLLFRPLIAQDHGDSGYVVFPGVK